MKFEKIGPENPKPASMPDLSRRNFLRNTMILTAGSLVPKFLHSREKNNLEVIEKNYNVLGQNIKAVLQIYTPVDKKLRKNLPFYFNMHDNEETSVEASRRVMGELGGRLLELRHSGERLIKVNYNGAEFSFDPNRIFTTQGVQDTLEKYNGKSVPVEIKEEVENFGQKLLEDFQMKNEKIIISLHNNFEGGYSIESYKKNGSDSLATEHVFINPEQDADNFFYVTKKEDFNKIRAMGYNVILQSSNSPDDGSLAVVAGENGIRYINIEAEHNETDMQEKMIRDIYKIIV